MRFKFGDNYDATLPSIRDTAEFKERLQAVARSEGVSLAEVMRVFLHKSLEEYEGEKA